MGIRCVYKGEGGDSLRSMQGKIIARFRSARIDRSPERASQLVSIGQADADDTIVFRLGQAVGTVGA